jgi:hypothetical protein
MISGFRFMTAVALGLSVAAGLGCHSDASYKLTWTFAGGEAASALTCARHGVFSILVMGSSEGGDTAQIEAPCGPGALTDGVASGNWSFAVKGLDMAGRYRGDLLTGAGPADAAADATGPADAAGDATGPVDATTDAVADAVADAAGPADAAADDDAGPANAAAADAAFLSAMVGPQSIDKGATALFAVVLTPLPACADGIDNDCDGRVDLDDPSCQDDPRGSEGDTTNCNQQPAGRPAGP